MRDPNREDFTEAEARLIFGGLITMLGLGIAAAATYCLVFT